MSWGAVFGGAVTSLAVVLLLYALGIALGLTTLDPGAGIQGVGIFTGVWGLVTAILALFVGGFVAGRGAGIITKGEGAVHGLVMWGLTTLVGAWMLVTTISTLVGGAATVGTTAIEGVGGLPQVAQQFGIDADDALAPINQQLRAEGRPEISAQELEAATGRAIQEGFRQGRLDRQLLVESLTAETALTRADAEVVATRIENQFNAALGDAETAAGEAARATGRAFWAVFGAMLLGLIAAMLGATLGVSKRQRLWSEGEEAVQGRRRHRPFFQQPRTNN